MSGQTKVKRGDRVRLRGVTLREGQEGTVRYVYKSPGDRFPIQVRVFDEDVFCQPHEVEVIDEVGG